MVGLFRWGKICKYIFPIDSVVSIISRLWKYPLQDKGIWGKIQISETFVTTLDDQWMRVICFHSCLRGKNCITLSSEIKLRRFTKVLGKENFAGMLWLYVCNSVKAVLIFVACSCRKPVYTLALLKNIYNSSTGAQSLIISHLAWKWYFNMLNRCIATVGCALCFHRIFKHFRRCFWYTLWAFLVDCS